MQTISPDSPLSLSPEDQDYVVFISGSPNFQQSCHLVDIKNYGKEREKMEGRGGERQGGRKGGAHSNPSLSTVLAPVFPTATVTFVLSQLFIFLFLIGCPQ